MNETVLDPALTLESKSSFLYSFFLLPKEKRRAIYTLYAFCRQTDDIVDNNNSPLEKRLWLLNRWEKELKRCFLNHVSNYFDSLHQVAEVFKIPFEYFLELIAGVRMDLTEIGFRSFEDLKLYCYRVASIVGLMSIEIFGYRDPQIKQYAENLGIALQLTNIIRDVGADARLGRIYIPEEDLERFAVTKAEIMNKRYSDRFYQLMSFQARRARKYYQLAEAYLPGSERLNMLVSEIMKNIYWRLLNKIEAEQYKVLDRRLSVSTTSKVWITLRTVSRIKLDKMLGEVS